MTIMAEGRRQKQEISLRDDLDAVVQYGGTTLELSADGKVIVNTNGNAARYVGPDSKALVRLNTAANETRLSQGVTVQDLVPMDEKPGDSMPDGTVHAGTSPDTHRPMYTTPADVPFTWMFDEAQRFAREFTGYGHKDWRVPTKNELKALFNNRAAI